MDSAKTPVNGHEKQDEPGVTISGSTSQAPMIDDSLIADDDEGLPLISAVFSLADGKTDETTFSGWYQFACLGAWLLVSFSFDCLFGSSFFEHFLKITYYCVHERMNIFVRPITQPP